MYVETRVERSGQFYPCMIVVFFVCFVCFCFSSPWLSYCSFDPTRCARCFSDCEVPGHLLAHSAPPLLLFLFFFSFFFVFHTQSSASINTIMFSCFCTNLKKRIGFVAVEVRVVIFMSVVLSLIHFRRFVAGGETGGASRSPNEENQPVKVFQSFPGAFSSDE